MKPVVFEMVVSQITVDKDAATLDLELPPIKPKPRSRSEGISTAWLRKQAAWFAGLNDEVRADEQIRIAVYGDDGRRFKAGQRVRITIEPVSK